MARTVAIEITDIIALETGDGKVRPIYKFGFNADVQSASEEVIWDGGGAFVRPSSAIAMTISSSSAADTSAGTGARTVKVFTLDGNFVEQVDTLTMDGQSGVAVGSTNRIRGWRLKVLTAGSGGQNAGTIYLGSGTITSGVPAVIYAQITIGQNQTLMTPYTVPADTKVLMQSLTVANQGLTASKFVTFRLVARDADLANSVFQTKLKFVIANGVSHVNFDPPMMFPEKTDLEVRAQAEAGATVPVSAEFNLILVQVPNQ